MFVFNHFYSLYHILFILTNDNFLWAGVPNLAWNQITLTVSDIHWLLVPSISSSFYKGQIPEIKQIAQLLNVCGWVFVCVEHSYLAWKVAHILSVHERGKNVASCRIYTEDVRRQTYRQSDRVKNSYYLYVASHCMTVPAWPYVTRLSAQKFKFHSCVNRGSKPAFARIRTHILEMFCSYFCLFHDEARESGRSCDNGAH